MSQNWNEVHIGMEPSNPAIQDGNDTTKLLHHPYESCAIFANYVLVMCIEGLWKAVGWVVLGV